VVAYEPRPDRIDFVAALAANWLRLRRMPAAGRSLAIVLANYPNRDGRLANGVGLDTPAERHPRAAGAAGWGYRIDRRSRNDGRS
jgi:cobaltochelatase CobN